MIPKTDEAAGRPVSVEEAEGEAMKEHIRRVIRKLLAAAGLNPKEGNA